MAAVLSAQSLRSLDYFRAHRFIIAVYLFTIVTASTVLTCIAQIMYLIMNRTLEYFEKTVLVTFNLKI